MGTHGNRKNRKANSDRSAENLTSVEANQETLGKLRRIVRRVGLQLAEKALTAFHVMRDRDTPRKHVLVLGSALAYLLVPQDLIPDYLPAVGWTDDAAAISTALVTVAVSVKPEHRERARRTIRGWGFKLA